MSFTSIAIAHDIFCDTGEEWLFPTVNPFKWTELLKIIAIAAAIVVGAVAIGIAITLNPFTWIELLITTTIAAAIVVGTVVVGVVVALLI